MTTRTESPAITTARNAYRALLALSGLTAEDFKARANSVIHQDFDGEDVGVRTPELWVRGASEVVWSILERRHGNKTADKLVRATLANAA